MVEETDSHGCGVWLMDNEDDSQCKLWMAYIDDQLYTRRRGDLDAAARFRTRASADHLLAYTARLERDDRVPMRDDSRLPQRSVRAFHRQARVVHAWSFTAGTREPDARVDQAVELEA